MYKFALWRNFVATFTASFSVITTGRPDRSSLAKADSKRES